MLSSDINFHVWSMQTDDNHVHTMVNALDPTLPQSNTCHHDTGTNCHVFHDRNAFETYKSTEPITVHGFGHNLSTTMIGRGTVQLESRHGREVHNIILHNILHMPAACTNLVSGIQLDKAGVMTMLSNGLLALATNGRTIVEGKIINNMYRLHLRIVPPSTTSLAL